MKKFSIALAAIGVAAAAVPTIASAQPYGAPRWESINQRQDNLIRRIDMGVRNGALTRYEADSLRRQFFQLAALENQYRRGGLNQWERNDLNRRFDLLSARIMVDRHDRDHRGPHRGPGRW